MILLKLSNVPLYSGLSDVLIGAVYVPPEQSPYYNRAVFDEIENCLASFDVKNVLLAGDFNARTSRLDDFITDHNDTDFTEESIMDCMSTLNIPFQRNSLDTERNNSGYALVEFCKCLKMLIVNGRVGDDRAIGQTTCKNVSVVDYFIANVELFPCFANFSVLDFERCISDVHNAIRLTITLSHENEQEIYANTNENNDDDNDTKLTRPKWQPGSEGDFIRNINVLNVRQLERKMLECLDDIHAVTQQNVDSFTNDFCDILKQSAEKCNMYVKKSGVAKSRKARPRKQKKCLWQNEVSRRARTTYRNAARNYRLRGTPTTNAVKNRTFSYYQKTLNKNFRTYVRNIRQRIRNLKTTDPRRYWKIINGSGKDKKDEYESISHEVFF